jgi:hypothetical protein
MASDAAREFIRVLDAFTKVMIPNQTQNEGLPLAAQEITNPTANVLSRSNTSSNSCRLN